MLLINYLILGAIKSSAWAAEAAVNGPLAWPEITRECRPGAYWHWLASAVDPTDLTRELERYRAAGMGGVHIIPIYGAKGYENQYIEYLSSKWLAMLAHTVREANRLDLFVDATLGTGWCFGGPDVRPEDASALLVIDTFTAPADALWKSG